MKNICLEIPQGVDYILTRLGEAGFEAFAVGGCVRDMVLGRVPNDWDITTSARPEEVKKVFRRTIDTGLKHGTVTVLVGSRELGTYKRGERNDACKQTSASQENVVKAGSGQASASQENASQSRTLQSQFEVTTYRIDGAYEDSRHPKEVTFTSNLEEDLRRRDFTINAMAYHPKVGIVDPYGGMADLEEGVIRAVGNPRERFDEDALRIMRAVRFSAQLGFAIDPETALALKEFAPRLNDISHERIRDELLKLITSPYPETFELLYNMKITREIFPRFDEMMAAPPAPGRAYNFGTLALYAMEEVSASATLRLAALLLHAGDVDDDCAGARGAQVSGGAQVPGGARGESADSAQVSGGARGAANFAKHFLREMRLDNNTIHDVGLLVEMVSEAGEISEGGVTGMADAAAEISEYDVRIMMNKAGELMPALIELLRADAKGFVAEVCCKDGGSLDSDGAVVDLRGKMLARAEKIADLYEVIRARGDCTSLKTLAVTGSDLIAAGFKPGPGLGGILASLLDEVLRDPAANTKEHLLERASLVR